jgi:hypothetical protein
MHACMHRFLVNENFGLFLQALIIDELLRLIDCPHDEELAVWGARRSLARAHL